MLSPAFMIADANGIYRRGLATLLTEHFTGCTVNVAATTEQLLTVAQQHWFDVLLIDTSLPAANSFEAARTLLQQYSDCRMVLYAHNHTEQVMVQAFAAGAAAFFNHFETPDTIIFIIREVLAKGCCITPDAFKAYQAAHTRIQNTQQLAKPLTRREQEILQLLLQGKTSRQIAEELHLSTKTVDNHRSNIMAKTGTHSITQLLLFYAGK